MDQVKFEDISNFRFHIFNLIVLTMPQNQTYIMDLKVSILVMVLLEDTLFELQFKNFTRLSDS